MGAAAYANMVPVLSQAVDLRFFAGTEHTAMNLTSFQKKLTPAQQDLMMEVAYDAQQYTQREQERAIRSARAGALHDIGSWA